MEIALLVRTSNEWSRNVLMGVADYSERVKDWRFTIPPASENGNVGLPANWRGDGIICRLTHPDLRQQVTELGLPCVNVSWLERHDTTIPKVVSCEKTCGEMAVEFLLEKQFENFGYVGFHPSENYTSELQDSIARSLTDHGKDLHIFDFTSQSCGLHDVNPRVLANWISNLPRPIGIIAWSSATGQLITSACKLFGLKVPDEVSILCVEHDPLFSALAPVPLTNIDQDPWRVGYSAAKLLHEMIKGRPAPSHPVRVPPIAVVARISTELTSVSDVDLAAAIHFINRRANDGINVADVVRHVGKSRRSLENKFKNHLQCSPGIYIRQVQLKNVARMLRTTKLTIVEIAFRTGFEYPEVLTRTFKKFYQITPQQFRDGVLRRPKAKNFQADQASI